MANKNNKFIKNIYNNIKYKWFLNFILISLKNNILNKSKNFHLISFNKIKIIIFLK